MLQIPKSLLPDTAEVHAPDPDALYDGVFLPPHTIGHVRFERVEALNPTQYSLADGAKGRIWVDAVNSDGAFEIIKGSKVVVDGETMQALSVATYKTGAKVHHWEVDVG